MSIAIVYIYISVDCCGSIFFFLGLKFFKPVQFCWILPWSNIHYHNLKPNLTRCYKWTHWELGKIRAPDGIRTHDPPWSSTDALTTELLAMWVFDSSCITQPQSQISTDSIAHNCLAQSHWEHHWNTVACIPVNDAANQPPKWANVRQWLTYIKYKVLQMNPLGTRKKLIYYW